jgi:WD40 repeat protein
VSCVSISPDGRWLVTGDGGAAVRIWDLKAPNPFAGSKLLQGQVIHQISNLAMSPSNRWLVTGTVDSTTQIWDLSSPNPAAHPQVLFGDEAFYWMGISSDGRFLVTRGRDADARLWLFEPADLLQLAKTVAGRELTAEERSQFDLPATEEGPPNVTAFRPGLPPMLMHQRPANAFQPPPPGPALLEPAADATLDNGSLDGKKRYAWEFKWEEVPGARCYHLHVIGSNVFTPLVDNATLTATSFRREEGGYFSAAACRWKVRAQTAEGVWTAWSEGMFKVAPPTSEGLGPANR